MKRRYQTIPVRISANPTTGSAWGTAGGDFDAVDMGSVWISANPATGSLYQISLDPVELKKMIDGTYPNYGWLLKLDTESNDLHTFASSDYATAADRPKLDIEYNTTSEPEPWTDKTYTYAKDQQRSKAGC